MTKKEMVALKIDDREVTVEKGTTIINAARLLGIDIPHFCDHPRLKPDANCRMCLVRIEKMPKLVASCAMPVAEEMVVWTNTPDVVESHYGVIEFLLANHPLDCPECDQGGECPLQNYSHLYGRMGSRNSEKKRVFEKEYFGPFIEREMNRCIACLRCVRYCDEVLDVKAIGPMDRGSVTQIGAFSHQVLDCEFCGGCIQICPVGALTSRPAMFEYRPWQLTKTETICPYCPDGCQIKVESRDQKVVRVTSEWGVGRNGGDLCAKGYFGYQVIDHPQRITMPLVRRYNRLVEVTSKEALDFVAKRIMEIKAHHGPSAIGGIITARCTNEDLYLFQKFMRLCIGTNNVDSSARYGYVNALWGMEKVFGAPRIISYEDIVDADVILMIGCDMTETNPIAGLKVKEAVKRRGALLISIDPYTRKSDPYRSHITRLTSHHLQIKPGSEEVAIYGLTKTLLEKEFFDRGLERYPEYIESLRKVMCGFSFGQIQERTGVEEKAFEEAARLFVAAERGVVIFGRGITGREGGAWNVVNLLDSVLLAGKATAPGCGVLPLSEENNELGALEMGAAPEFLPGLLPIDSPHSRERLLRIWKESPPPEKGLTLFDMIEAAGRGEIKALYLVGENPLATLPASSVEEALKKVELLVCQELFLTETAGMAHVILPAASFAEKEGSFTNLEGRVQKVRQALEPIGESRPDWRIFSHLARRLGFPLEYNEASAISAEIAQIIPRYGKAHSSEEEGRCLDLYLTAGYRQDLSRRYAFPDRDGEGGPYYLIMGQVLFHSGKMSTRSENLTMLFPEGRLVVGPEDAARLQLGEGEMIRVRTARGDLAVKVKISPKYPQGLVFFPEHFTTPPMKDLMPLVVDPVTRVPYFKEMRVSLEK